MESEKGVFGNYLVLILFVIRIPQVGIFYKLLLALDPLTQSRTTAHMCIMMILMAIASVSLGLSVNGITGGK